MSLNVCIFESLDITGQNHPLPNKHKKIKLLVFSEIQKLEKVYQIYPDIKNLIKIKLLIIRF